MRAHHASGGWPAASARNPATACARSRATTVANLAVPGAVMVERCGPPRPAPPRRQRPPSNRPAPPPSTPPARGVLPDTTNVDTAGRGCAGAGIRNRACSSTTCALVPPNPNEDTPARRGRPVDGHSVCLGNDFQPQSETGSMRIGVGNADSAESAPLHRQHRLDETRDPGRRLQMTQIGLDRADQQRRVLRTPRPKHRASARASIGSPSRVPVPWAST